VARERVRWRVGDAGLERAASHGEETARCARARCRNGVEARRSIRGWIDEDGDNGEAREREGEPTRDRKGERGYRWKAEGRETRGMRERETDSPTDRTRLASTSSDVATAQQSPGLASLSISRRGGFPSLPSREERPFTPPPSRYVPRPAAFPGPRIDPTSVRTYIRP